MGESEQSTVVTRLCWSLLLLLAFYSTGCLVFVTLEREAELKTYAENRQLYEHMKELYTFGHCKDPVFQSLSFCQNQAAFSASLLEYFNQHGNSMEDRHHWTVLGSLFFLTHLATTIGYGHSHPRTQLGQVATIVYGLIGIPIMGYVLAQVARLLLRGVVFVLEKAWGVRVNTVKRQIFVLWFLLMVFLLGGAFVYSQLEPWTYLQSVYFCFVTLSTVGFGDFLPSSTISKTFSIFYMIFGLGVCASIIAAFTGLVAEGHDSADRIVAQQKLREDWQNSSFVVKLQGTCEELCCASGGRSREQEA